MPASGEPDGLVCEREFVRASKESGVPLGVLYAVGLTESGARGRLHPLALNIGGEPHYPENVTDALARIDRARQSGVALIDVGCMQINIRFHLRKFGSVRAMLDPDRNVRYGASFLKELHTAVGNWTSAVARYHAGAGNPAAQKRYVCAVVRHMIDAGFGDWTPTARNACRDL